MAEPFDARALIYHEVRRILEGVIAAIESTSPEEYERELADGLRRVLRTYEARYDNDLLAREPK